MINSLTTSSSPEQSFVLISPIQWLRNQLNQVEIRNPKIAQLICKLIPSTCPFARTIKFLGKTLLVIPPLCHFNPLYEELIGLRFRALTFLSNINLEY